MALTEIAKEFHRTNTEVALAITVTLAFRPVGAFLFGLGMQLGGGCASGTLYTAGGGNTRMLVTLIFFIAGSALGASRAVRQDHGLKDRP